MSVIKDSTATLRPDLSVALQEFATQKAVARLAGLRVLPLFESATDTGEYAVFKRENVLEVPDTARSEGGYNRVTATVGSKTFQCEEHGLEFVLSDKKAKKYARYMDFERAMAETLYYKILLGHERRTQTLLATLTLIAATGKWSAAATNVIGDVDTRATALGNACGVAKSELSLLVTNTDFQNILSNTELRDRVKYTTRIPGMQDQQAQLVAEALGLKEVVVATAGYNTKNKGVAPVISGVWTAGRAFLYLAADEGASLETPCIGRTILWTGDSPELPVVETYRDETVRSNVLRVRGDLDEVLQGIDANIFGCQINIDP